MGKLKAAPARLGFGSPKVRSLPKQAEGFYQSAAWRQLAADVKRARGGYCERCGSNKRVVADHKVERRDGGADLDEANIELLCARCHGRKTAEARRLRALGEAGREGG